MRTIATAGHVDHGKSTLVHALTGTDPDRLADEKARGLTIDLGFAFTTLASGTVVGFVDVPGHVRFLKNMLAGAGAVELALLVVAADDGWMPQSEEHAQLLELLGVTTGIVAITKADSVDADALTRVRYAVAERMARSTWRDAPIVVCDAITGRGLDTLRAALDTLLAGVAAPADHERPRLWVDRSFSARGAGTVTTGTLAGGAFRVGDEVVIARTGVRSKIRGIQSGHREVDVAAPGARVAVNLAGIEPAAIRRGDALVRRNAWIMGTVVDVGLSRLPGGAAPSPRGELIAYVGSGEHHVRCQPLDESGIYARVGFPAPVALVPGDRLVLRDSGSGQTIAGATVLDVDPTTAARGATHVLALPLGARLLASHGWLTNAELGRRAGISAREAQDSAARLVDSGTADRVGVWLVARDTLVALERRARGLVQDRHDAHPLDPGLELARLASALELDVARTRTLVEHDAQLELRRDVVATLEHAPLENHELEARDLLAALDRDAFAPPDAVIAAADPAVVRALLRDDRLVDVGGIVFTRSAVDRARTVVVSALRGGATLSVGDVRELLDTSRKYAVPLLEHFDRAGVTRRRGDVRSAGRAAAHGALESDDDGSGRGRRQL